MANYDILKNALQNAVDWDNNDKQISGNDILAILLSLVNNTVVVGYQFVDTATPTTNPGTPDQNVWYLASKPGTYANFGGLVVNDGEVCALCWNGTWIKKVSGAATAAQVDDLIFPAVDISSTVVNRYYIKTGTIAIGGLVDMTPVYSNSYKSITCRCKKGDRFIVTATGGNAPCAWAFIDENDILQSRYTDGGIPVVAQEVTAPADGIFTSACQINATFAVIAKRNVINKLVDSDAQQDTRLDNDENRISDVESSIDDIGISTGLNLLNLNDADFKKADSDGGYVLQNDGSVVQDANYTTSVTGFMPITGGATIYSRQISVGGTIIVQTMQAVAFYDSDKAFISIDTSYPSEITAPNNAAYMRAQVGSGFLTLPRMITCGVLPISYEPFRFRTNKAQVDKWELVMPSKIYIAAGVEYNVDIEEISRYFNPQKVGRFELKGFNDVYNSRRVTPANSTADFTTTAFVYAKDTIFVDKFKSMDVKIVPTTSGSGASKTALFIGDSHTQRGEYTQGLLDMFSTDLMNLSLIGTRGTAPNLNEGRQGWSAYDYTHIASKAGVTNAFWDGSAFNFAWYMQQNGFSGVDYVFINLGNNDQSALAADADILRDYNTMITSIKSYNANIKIGIGLPPTKATRGSDAMRYQKDLFMRINQLLIGEYDGRESENLYIVPLNIGIDTEYDYPMSEVNVSASNSTYKHYIVTDDTHPALAGYLKMSKAIFPYIKFWGGM